MSPGKDFHMIPRSAPIWRILFFVCIFLSMTGTAVRAEAINDPAAFITNIVSVTLQDLTASDIDDAERTIRFHRIIDKTFAVDLAGKWILGQYWKEASPPQRTEFLRLLKERMVSHNVAHFKRFKAVDVNFEIVMTQTISENDYLVKTRIGDASGSKPVSMGWRVIRRDGRLWVFDVMVEGMSMGLAHKQEYQSVIRRNDGDIEDLLAALRK